MSTELLEYASSVSLRDDDILRELRRQTAELPGGKVLPVQAEEGQLLAFLVTLTQTSTILEIGTYTGYSTLCMARALPDGGRLVTCDVNPKWPAIGLAHWQRAEVADRIDVRVGNANEVLSDLLSARDFGPDSFDLAFIDADKEGYPDYYELSLRLIRPGGLIVVDNTLFFGRVLDQTSQDAGTSAVRRLNSTLFEDERVDLSLLPMADGITLVRKKSS